ncbi:DNA-directed RNA polymerase 3, chloroplastic [Hordeum vulgare]|nr:DNA-directed RNA polymerase 3, chloroplastic [Hordeum vulgare]
MEVMEAKEWLPKETKGKAKEKNQAWDEVQSVLNKEEVEEVDFLQPYLHLLSPSLIELLRFCETTRARNTYLTREVVLLGNISQFSKMELSFDEEFVLADSSSDDGSDVENLLANHRQQVLVVVMAIKEYEDRRRSRQRRSKVGRLCIPRKRHLGNELLMRDYFAQRPTYPANLFG